MVFALPWVKHALCLDQHASPNQEVGQNILFPSDLYRNERRTKPKIAKAGPMIQYEKHLHLCHDLTWRQTKSLGWWELTSPFLSRTLSLEHSLWNDQVVLARMYLQTQTDIAVVTNHPPDDWRGVMAVFGCSVVPSKRVLWKACPLYGLTLEAINIQQARSNARRRGRYLPTYCSGNKPPNPTFEYYYLFFACGGME